MKKSIIAFACTGVLTAGVIAGGVGFRSIKNTKAEGSGKYTMLSTTKVDGVDEIKADGTITGVTEVALNVMPAVVSITNKSVQEVQDMFGMYGWYGFGFNGRGNTRQYETESRGSGIIIGQNDEELLICTNNHVVEDATEITVGFVDEEIYKAVVKGTDASNDLAVVSVKLEDISDDTMDQIRIAEIGDSDELLVGQQVVAIGNALGYGQSVTTGIVSALNRQLDHLDGYETAQLIQTDAAINPGNSGGPLLDMQGRVIGINSAKASSNGVEGMGYAIPISSARTILEDLMNKKTRTEVVDEKDAAYMGIVGQDVSYEVAELYGIPQGIFLTEVSKDSPAEKAGLKKGDIIVKFDGDDVKTMLELREELSYYSAGETVDVVISTSTDGEYEESTIELTLGNASDYNEVN